MSNTGVSKGAEFYEYPCVICGKTICTSCPQDWAYKRYEGGKGTKLLYCCSWKCFRQLPERNGVGIKTNKKEEIFELLREGKSRKEIAETLGVTRDTVKYWQMKFKG